MTDIASLAIQVDARTADQAKVSLEKLAQAGARTEAATNSLEAEYRDATAELNRMKAAQESVTMQMGKATLVMGGANATSRAMQANMLNLSRQGADVATMFALGAPPMQIFASQGLQIVDVLAMMRMEAKATGTSLTSMAAGGLSKIGPYALAAAAAAGVLSVAFSALTDEINENSAVTVTWQDTALGAFDMLADYVSGTVTQAFIALGLDIGRVWQNTVTGVTFVANTMLGTFMGARNAVIAAWRTFPGAFADLVISGVNAAIQGLEDFVNGAISLVNDFSGNIADKLGTSGPQIDRVSFGGISNQWEGQARAFGGQVRGAFNEGFSEGFGVIGRAAEMVMPYAEARARQGAVASAAETGRQVGRSLGQSAAAEIAREVEDALKLSAAKLEAIKQQAISAAAEQDLIDRKVQAEIEARRMVEEEARSLEAARIKESAYLFETLFSQGIGGLWDEFARQGQVAIAQIAAKWSLSMGNNGGIGGLFSGVGEAFKANPVGVFASAMQLSNQLGKGLAGLIGVKYDESAGRYFGVVGGIIGGLFGSTKYGTAVLSGQGAAGITAKGKGRADEAGGLAGSVQDQLAQIASALGVSVGAYNVSIGTYKDSFRVSASGKTGKLKGGDVRDFGDDQEAALAFALSDAIKDGAILARASIKKLLGSGTDTQAQLDKAVKFQAVFDSLLETTDPLAFAMQEIGRQADQLRAIFDEAGASAAEYADLEKLLALKREEAVDAARAAKLDELTDQFSLQIRLLELMGESSQALTAARILEVAGMKASLQPLQAMVYELEDARAVIAKFGPLGDDLRAFKRELVGGAGAGSFGALAARFRATAGDAAIGDADALAAFRNDATAYLEAARDNASSALEYQRALAEVLTGADKGIFAADTTVQMSQATIDAVVSQTSVIEAMRTEIREANVQIAGNTGALLRLWQRFEGEGLTVKTDADTPLATVAQ